MPSTATTTNTASAQPAAPPNLPGYAGEWTPRQAAHLLRRATFDTSYARISEATEAGLAATLDSILIERPLPDQPVVISPLDGVAIGQTWVDQPYNSENLMGSVVARISSLFGWIGSQIVWNGDTVHEKLLLFWHNHFAITTAVEPKYNYRYLTTLRTHMLGSFRQLVKEINVDPLMLGFLNGNQNTAVAPNENYARELLELFTIGKGPQAGPDDYTNYTEQDVREMARILTGWRNYGFNDTESGEFGSLFVPRRHDNGPKTLSHRFGGVTVNFNGETAHEQLVDLILEQEEVARFIVRKLYRWFVYYDITPAIEAEVIEPLAQLFRESDYQIGPTLRCLLSSAHFFDTLNQGPMIKNPLDFLTGTYTALAVNIQRTGDARRDYRLATQLLQGARDLGMLHFTLPNVAGWKAYYQEPLYYRLWINSATLPLRQQFIEDLLNNGVAIGPNRRETVALLPLIEQFPQPENLEGLLEGFTLLLFPLPLTEGQREFLKEVLLQGLPETQWAVEYSDYLANPNDENLRVSLEGRLRTMIGAMLSMPEYQLS